MSIKARVRVAGADVELEGSRDEIAHVLRDLLGVGQRAPMRPAVKEAPAETPPRAPDAEHIRLDERVFRVGAEGELTLQRVPEGPEAEVKAMALLTQGLSAKLQRDEVPATRLVRALRHSGLTVERLDRIASLHPELFLKSGERRGSRYRLTSRGRSLVDELVSHWAAET